MDLIGTIIGGKYRLEKQLGEGGMGMVYAATQVGLNRKCAVKLLHESLSKDGQLVARFKREAEVAASIGHPNIVQVTDFGFEGDRVFLVMDLLKGMPLADAIEQQAPLAAERVRFITTQVLSALDAAHERDIVHRDLKPDNIYLTSMSGVADVVKLLDFGIARMTSEQSQKMTSTGQVLGTPAYMSPEQARGQKVDRRTDLYSLGVVMYEALSGRMPVDGSNYHELMFNIVGQDPIPLAELRPDLPKGLLDIVAKSMAKGLSQRYQTATEMRRELEALGPIEASSPPAVQVPATRVGGATTDADAFAKTVTPEAVLAIDTQPAAVPAVPTGAAVTARPASKSKALGIGIAVVVLLTGAVAFFATRPEPVVAVNAPPTEDAESKEDAEERARELAKLMVEEMRREEHANEDHGDGESAEMVSEEAMVSMATESPMTAMSSMASMSSMSSSAMGRADGRPAQLRHFDSEPPPAGIHHPPWADFSGIPIVYQRCGSSRTVKEVYPILPRTQLEVNSFRSNNVVALDQLRPWAIQHMSAITQCYRGHPVLRGQRIIMDLDAEGNVGNVHLHDYCPVPESVRNCIRRELEGEHLPPDQNAPGEFSFNITVVGA